MLATLKNHFVDFLRSRHWATHFRRIPMLDQLARTPTDLRIPPALGERLRAAATAEPAQLLHDLGSSSDGLDVASVEAIRVTAGWNTIAQDKPMSAAEHLWLCFRTPFNLLLTLLAMVSWVTEDMKATIVIGSMVLLATVLRFWQEGRANKAAAALQAMVSNTATVLRRKALTVEEDAELDVARDARPSGFPTVYAALELAVRELVPGDVIKLSAGDMVPADCRLLLAKDLFLAQSAMTGESMPVEKYASLQGGDASNPVELDNIVFMGTNVVSGAGTAVVVATGNHTYLGALAGRATAMDRAPTAFQTGVNKVSWVLIRFMMVTRPRPSKPTAAPTRNRLRAWNTAM